MKKLYAILICCSVAAFSFGQARISNGTSATPAAKLVTGISVMGTDTLVPPSFGMPFQCDSAPVYYNWTPASNGYVFGNNAYGETECAQKYYATGTVDEVLVWIAYASGTSGSTMAKIYTIDAATKGPSATVSGTSATILTGALTTTVLTSYTFTPAVTVTNEFAAAVVFPTTTSAGDTIAVVSTKIGCATPDSLSWMNLPQFGGWLPTVAVIQGSPNCDLYIIPVGTLTNLTGINDMYAANGLTLKGAFPSPAIDVTTIMYSISEASEVSVTVFDLTGKTIYASSDNKGAGNHEVKLSLKNIPAGNYYYTVKTNSAKLTSKFSVVR